MDASIKIGVLRLPAVVKTVGLSRSSIYQLMKMDEFPRPIQLSFRAVGWRCADIDAWLAARKQAGMKGGA